jgi:hypothetical protein
MELIGSLVVPALADSKIRTNLSFDMGKSGQVVKYGGAARCPSVMAVGTDGQIANSQF